MRDCCIQTTLCIAIRSAQKTIANTHSHNVVVSVAILLNADVEIRRELRNLNGLVTETHQNEVE